MPLSIFQHLITTPVPHKHLAAVCARICRAHARSTSKQVNLIICTNGFIRDLNRRYRRKNRVTDVLSFTIDEPDMLGEIYICASRAKLQAREYGHSYAAELERLLVHGMFHLLGFDHKTRAQRNSMEAHEARFCTVAWTTGRTV